MIETLKVVNEHLRERQVRAKAAVLALGLLAAASVPGSEAYEDLPDEPILATVEPEQIVGEKIAALMTEAKEVPVSHADSTVQIRFQPKAAAAENPDGDLASTSESCSATHIGDGWFVTARHCFRGEFAASNIAPRGAVYDLTTEELADSFSVWGGSSPEDLQKIGEPVDHILINGNEAESDLALIHVPGAEDLPSLRLVETLPSTDESYELVGYPEATGFTKTTTNLNYLATMSALELGDTSLGDIPMHVFAAPANPDAPGSECRPGNSGGSAINPADGRLIGALSRYEVTGSYMWNRVRDRGFDLPEDATLCLFEPADIGTISQLMSAVDIAAPAESAVL